MCCLTQDASALRFLALAIRPFRNALRGSRFKMLSAIVELTPRRGIGHGGYTHPQTVRTEKTRRGRVVLMQGCVQRVLRPEINDASVRFLIVLATMWCWPKVKGVAARSPFIWARGDAKAFAKRNIDAWHAQRQGEPFDAIIVNASGCGTTVKDYAHLFAGDPAYAEKAKYVSALAKDISEFAAHKKIDRPLALERH